jgi:hypothetical protein
MDLDLGSLLERHAPAVVPASLRLDEILGAVVRTVQHALPGFDEVSVVTLEADGRTRTRAGTSDLVWELDRLQCALAEGPMVDALGRDPVVAAPCLRDESRWPGYVPRAVERGVRGQVSTRLQLGTGRALGVLNVYSTSTEHLDEHAVGLAGLLAAQTAVALGAADEVQHLQEALRSRKVIGQAIGLLMAERHLTEQAAWEHLVRTSSHTNVKVRQIAARMVESANARAGH